MVQLFGLYKMPFFSNKSISAELVFVCLFFGGVKTINHLDGTHSVGIKLHHLN